MSDNILIIRFGSLGDLLLASAPVLNLKINNPTSKLYLLTKEHYKDIASLFDGVDEVISIPPNISLTQYLKLLLETDKIHFSKIIDLHGNPRSWLARKVLSADQHVAYYKRRAERERIVRTNRIPLSYPHTVDLYNEALEQSGSKIFCSRPIINTNYIEESYSTVRESNRVIIAPGASYNTKQYSLTDFYKIASGINNQTDSMIDWVIPKDDKESSVRVLEKQQDWLQLHVDRPFSELVSMFSGAELVIANDSGMMHLASAVGTPVIGIFGPTHPSLGFAPKGFRDMIIETNEPCRPCSLHGKKDCRMSEQFCFTRIDTNTVVEKAVTQIEQSRQATKALFVDRDGTVITDKHYLSNPDDVELIDKSAEALREISEAGYKIIIVSNQSGVARQFHSIKDVELVNGRMNELLLQKGVEVDAVFYCPHHTKAPIESEYAIVCNCRKPSAGLPEEAAKIFNINLRKSVVIGDSLVDYDLGRVIGGKSFLVRTGYGIEMEKRLIASNPGFANNVYDNLYQAVQAILKVK